VAACLDLVDGVFEQVDVRRVTDVEVSLHGSNLSPRLAALTAASLVRSATNSGVALSAQRLGCVRAGRRG